MNAGHIEALGFTQSMGVVWVRFVVCFRVIVHPGSALPPEQWNDAFYQT